MQTNPVTRERSLATASESNQRIYEFLKSQPVGVLATVDDDKPHAAVIYYSIDKSFEITFATQKGTKKHNNMINNKNVMLLAYEPLSQTTTQITGMAEPIEDKLGIGNTLLGALKASKNTSQDRMPPIIKLKSGEYIGYRIRPSYIRMAVFIRPDPSGNELYETVEFKA